MLSVCSTHTASEWSSYNHRVWPYMLQSGCGYHRGCGPAYCKVGVAYCRGESLQAVEWVWLIIEWLTVELHGE